MNIIKKLVLSAGLVLVWLPASSFAQERNLERLESVRDQIVFPELTDAEKRTMAEQAQIFMRDLYVHRFDKLDFYPGLGDQVPAIEEVVNNIDSLSVTEMEKALYNIFVSQRDLHLNYLLPSPYANFRSFLPLTFTRTASRRDFFEVRINAIDEEAFKAFAPDQRTPEIGDKVVRYDNLPISQAVERQLATGQGANRFGGFTRAIGQMTFVPHRLHLVPEQNEVTITLVSSKKRRYGRPPEHYTITLPWIAQLPAAPTLTSAAREFAPAIESRVKKFNPETLNEAKNIWQEEFNNFVASRGMTQKSDYPSNPSAEPTLTWGTIDNRFGHFGYFNLSSFVPENGTDFTIEEIRRIIFEEFDETDGLIFDVRNNGGGSIVLADKLSQLFSRNDTKVIDARLLNTDLNRTIFNDSLLGQFIDPAWATAINDVEGTDERYSARVPFTSDADANALGQAYYKPVAVLMNARSYSATDLFTCAMRDNVAALVYGEDPLTGAGGANVITHELFNDFGPEEFEDLPGNHSMRVSWRQSVRFGRSDGKIIEDFGCEADVDASQTKNDIVNGGQDQIKTITRSLAKRARNYRYRAEVRPLENDTAITLGASEKSFDLFVKNTPYINIRVNGEVVDQVPVFARHREKLVSVPLPDALPSGAISFVSFEGVSFFGKRLWNVKRQFIILGDKVVIGDDGLSVDFTAATSIDPLIVLNRSAAENGWNLVNPNLQVGFNPEYVDNLNTDAILFMDLSNRESVNLSVDLEIDTELDFDFIEVFVEDGTGRRTTLLRESGLFPLATYDFDISEFAGQDSVLLHFQFISDGGVVAPGVKIQKIDIK